MPENLGNTGTLTQRRAGQLRLALARTASAIFVTDGDTSATVERIAAAAGVSQRTFYRHFAVKEDVVLPLFRASSEQVVAALRRAPRTGDLVDALVTAWSASLPDGTVDDHGRRFLTLMVTTPEYRFRWLQVDRELSEATATFLRERVDPAVDPALCALTSHLLVQATRYVFDGWITSGSPEPVPPLLARAFRLVLAGLAAEGHRTAAPG